MEGIEDVLANLDVIQKSISSSNNCADIASVQYVCKNIDEYQHNGQNTKIMVKSLNILHDSILLLPSEAKDETYLFPVVKGILKCIFVNDLYRMVDSVVLELSEDKKIFEIIKREIDILLSTKDVPDDIKSRYRNLRVKVVKKKSNVEEAQQDLSDINPLNMSINESPRPNDMLMIKRMPIKIDNSAMNTPRILNITFLPQSLTEQWALAKTSEEVRITKATFVCCWRALVMLISIVKLSIR
jgi:hypothetical protein